MVSRHQRKKIISVRTNAVLLPMMTPVAVGSIDTDRITNAYESSSSLNRTHQIEVQRVFEVADAAEMTMEQAPAVEAPAEAEGIMGFVTQIFSNRGVSKMSPLSA